MKKLFFLFCAAPTISKGWRNGYADLIKNNVICLIAFIGLFLCGTHVTKAQVKKVSGGLTETPLNSVLPDLQKSWRPITGKPKKFQGLGWQIIETKTRALRKNGKTPGFQSYIGFCKGKKSGVFVLSNSVQLKATPLGQELLGFLTGDPQPSAGTPDE